MPPKHSVALVTGAGKENGIGFASARKLALRGFDVAMTDIAENQDGLNELAAALAAESAAVVLPAVCDVADDASMRRCVDRVIVEFGRIDVLFNNAGIGVLRAFEETDMELFDLMQRVNLRGVVMMSKLVLPLMRRQGGGVIINNASVAGEEGTAGMTAYCASKHAVVGFTKALAAEVGGDQIRILAIAPGIIETDIWREGLGGFSPDERARIMREARQMSSLGRSGRPDEVGDLVAFLAGDEASFVSGACYRIDGGSVGGWV